MYINLIPDNSIASAPSGLTAVVQAAARYYDQLCPSNYTVNISYGWGTYDNQAYAPLTTNSGDFSVGGFDWSSGTSYSQLKEWLTSSAITTDQITAVQSLPASSASLPGGANGFGVSNAEKKALGVYAGPNGVVDGSIGFNTGDSAADFKRCRSDVPVRRIRSCSCRNLSRSWLADWIRSSRWHSISPRSLSLFVTREPPVDWRATGLFLD